MKLKSYFSGTVEAAMELARRELGEEALLMNARRATPETRHLGAYEVVFGVSQKPETAAASAATGAQSAALKSSSGTAADVLAQDVADLKREIERMAQSLRGARMIGTNPASRDSAAIYTQLVENELDTALAQQVAEGTPIEDLFGVDATLGRRGVMRGDQRGIVVLVGPPGAGKTTTLAKLAARYGLTSRKPAQILSVDICRIAAAEQLRSLASILGIGFEVAETPAALAQAFEEHRAKDWIFIDTPGLAKDEMEDGAELANFIASHPEIDTHLVLPASMKPADMARAIDRYEMFRPKKLLFTRIDETDHYGALISEAARRGLPISFLTTGQQIPDDLEPATKEFFVERIGGLTSRAISMGATA